VLYLDTQLRNQYRCLTLIYNSDVPNPERPKHITRRTALTLLLCGASRPLSAENWPQFRGPGGSPVLFEDSLIVNCDGLDTQYIAALDTGTGKVRWKTSRAGSQAYTTPLVIEAGGRTQVISPGAYRASAYDPRTGNEIWRVRYGQGFSNVPRPVFGAGLVFICSGFF
jgi:outer membrane protein assembly factor BamB